MCAGATYARFALALDAPARQTQAAGMRRT